jgi:CRP-like cAMP-binding protein
MIDSIHLVLENLPASSLTTHVLGALDYIVPGEWQNITVFQDLIVSVTGDSDEGLVQQVGERAIQHWFDESQGYQRAVQIYRLVDDASTVAGAAAMANMLGSRFEILGFLSDVIPKPDTTQAIDTSVKFVAEPAAYCYVNGIPGDSVGDFASSLASYGKEELMRIAAWLALDCVLPLGPDFMQKILDAVRYASESDLWDNALFRKLSEHLPGDVAAQKALFEQNLDAGAGFLNAMVQERAVSQESILERVRQYVDIADDKLDVLAAAIDLSTNYFEHTGIQTVTRRLVSRAYGEI